MTRTVAKKYKHECAVLDTGALQARCFENREAVPHWTSAEYAQDQQGTARAHMLAIQDLTAHVLETGHMPFKHRHGGPR